jgi:hypothetical protein
VRFNNVSRGKLDEKTICWKIKCIQSGPPRRADDSRLLQRGRGGDRSLNHAEILTHKEVFLIYAKIRI